MAGSVTSVQIKIILLSLILSETSRLCYANEEPKKDKEELNAEETKKLEIIKRIKKINEDGSYTIGYEADDGSFKIESRDVLGHIKGTYGFVDEDGQIKRVSYTSTNSSEIINKPETPSVVQRIPAKKPTPTTYIFTSTQSTPISSTISSPLNKRKTTKSPNYHEVSSTNKPKYVTYTSAAPKVLLQGKSINSKYNQRPETIEDKEVNTVTEKPVTEDAEPETGSNILRRELPQRSEQSYDVREHVFNLQQSLGHDSVDVYSGSMTTGTPRPLFTTTARSRAIFSTVPSISLSTQRPTSLYPVNYLKNSLQDIESTSSDYIKETTASTTPKPTNTVYISSRRPEVEPSTSFHTTPRRPEEEPSATVHISPRRPEPSATVNIAPKRPEVEQEPLVAIRHPHQKNTILVPLSHLQRRIIPIEQFREANEESRQYYIPQQSTSKVVEIEQQPAVVRRLPPHPLRPMPVQVDENGYLRELPRQVPTPYPIPVPASQISRYVNQESDIDNIQPPVSTKDFQRLLQQLILRQSRLEKISALTRQPPEVLMQPEPQRYREIYQQPNRYYQQRQYVQKQEESDRNYIHLQQQQQTQRPNIYEEYEPQSYRPNRRVARLLPATPAHQESEEFLPSDVREMLLLRMLQLAINPALPLDEDDVEVVSKSKTVKRTPVRNVEILGEDESAEHRKLLS